MTVTFSEYRTEVLKCLKIRNQKENESFSKLVKSYNKISERCALLTSELNEAKFTIQKLQNDNLDAIKQANPLMVNLATNEKIHELEEKLLKSKDEVIELQKKLVDQSQQVIKLNQQLKESNEELSHKEAKYLESENKIEILKHKLEDSENKIANYELAAKTWHDEKVESEMQFNILLQKFDKLKEENQLLLNSQLKIREEQIERINRLNEQEELTRHNRMKAEIANACATTTINDQKLAQSLFDPKNQINCTVRVFNRAIHKFECHDGEVNAVKYHKTGKYFTTGGGDRKIKLWEFKDNKTECIGNLIGSNASIASIDIDNESNLIAGTSFDFACRLWSLNDNRLRLSNGDLQPTHTLTGHTNKVLTGKFLGNMKIVTGSYDRTLKVWDLMQKACIKTLFAGSSCNDAIALDNQSVISGHLDKKIRFWDIRADQTQSEIIMGGKISSLDLSASKNYLLANIKDINALKLIDIRMNQVVQTFVSDDFKTSVDWAKAIFSPDLDMQYVCAGSSDGCILIWNTQTTRVEKILKTPEHNSSVLSLAWHPHGSYLISGDNKKKAVIWN